MSVKDLISAALNNNAVAFESNLNDIMSKKVELALQNKFEAGEAQTAPVANENQTSE